MALRWLRRHLAGGPRPIEDSVMVIAPDADALEQAGAVVDHLTSGRWRLSVVVVARGDPARLAARFSEAEIRQPRLPFGLLTFAALAALRVRSAFVLEPARLDGNAAALARGAARRGVPVFENEDPALSLQANEDAALSTAMALAAAVGAEREPSFSPDHLAARLSAPALRRVLFPWITRLTTIEDLAALLNRPKRILCLGNGPSGRNTALALVAHDALFRVNHDWRANGLLERPDMVFAGVKRSMRRMGPTLLGVASERKAAALLACRGLEPWHGRASFAVVEDVAKGVVSEVPDGLKPTTGAYMLATAVALRPDEIIVAGMDMFAHPGGAYAGGGAEINAYTPSHSFEMDAAFIMACLRHFSGRLVSYSSAFSDLARDVAQDAGFELVDRSDQ
ncbi:MAG: hypothetical protein AAGE80_12475 [Pseudomonadota bacterium]